ncbi:MAG: hypothetical protein JST87_05290 [Bacteroidetes bacterium]|nr:hypothetical protein [Bacteroidota bacterium]
MFTKQATQEAFNEKHLIELRDEFRLNHSEAEKLAQKIHESIQAASGAQTGLTEKPEPEEQQNPVEAE